MSIEPILPGATIGVLGSGQLGRMFAIAARRMGYRVHVLSPDTDTPTGQVADVEVVAPYDDLDAVAAFARGVDVVTFEFENVPAETTDAAAAIVPCRPSGLVLHISQQRAREKGFLARQRLPGHAVCLAATAGGSRQRRCVAVGLPAVLKTAGFGYDGKGQVLVETPDGCARRLARDWASRQAVLERFIQFDREVSVVAARGLEGWVVTYPVIENTHVEHILDMSVLPGRVASDIEVRAREIARGILETLDVVGVLCVEFFLTADGELLVNETGAAAAQLGTPDDRRLHDQPVRAAAPRHLRAAARIRRAVQAGGDGQPARRPVGGGRTRLDGGVPPPSTSGCTCTGRQPRARAEDGSHHGARGHRRRGPPDGAPGSARRLLGRAHSLRSCEGRAPSAPEGRAHFVRARGGVAEGRTRQAGARGGVAEGRTRQARARGGSAEGRTRQARARGGSAEGRTRQARARGGSAEGRTSKLVPGAAPPRGALARLVRGAAPREGRTRQARARGGSAEGRTRQAGARGGSAGGAHSPGWCEGRLRRGAHSPGSCEGRLRRGAHSPGSCEGRLRRGAHPPGWCEGRAHFVRASGGFAEGRSASRIRDFRSGPHR